MFNLVDDEWIPVRHEGRSKVVSLRWALLHAQEIPELEGETPITIPSIVRFLLAVLYGLLTGPRNVRESIALLASGQLPADRVNHYLDENLDRFDLFGASHPPFQVRQEEDPSEGNASGIARLMTDRASGTNKLLFDHTTEANPPTATPAEAARFLLTRQTTAVPEGKGYSPGPAGGAAFVLPLGRNLFETLVLNLVPQPAEQWEHDAPIWEQPPMTATEIREAAARGPAGFADLLTWRSRSVRLHEPDPDGYVRTMYYAPGIKFEAGTALDPMVAYRKDPKRGLIPLRFSNSKAFWRDFPALLPNPAGESFIPPAAVVNARELYHRTRRQEPITLLVAGLKNDKAKIEFWRSATFRVPVELFASTEAQAELHKLMDMADHSGFALHQATYGLAASLLTVGEHAPHTKDVEALLKTFPASANYWSRLEVRFPLLLSMFAAEPFQQILHWWNEEIISALHESWDLARTSAGYNPRSLRATARASGPFDAHIRRLRALTAL